MKIVLTVLGVVTLGVITWALIAASNEHTAWVNNCTAQGGHVDKHTEGVTTYTNGHVGYGTSTTYFCLSSDGRILGIS